jgi:hypothetical protein
MKNFIKNFLCVYIVFLICVSILVPLCYANAINLVQIPEDSYEFNGNYYKIYIENLTWDDAKLYCEELGGHLATITTNKEQNFISSINPYSYNLWIGAFRDEAFNWQWVTGEEWNYNNWGEDEPNNSSSVIANENCVAIWPDNWNDLNSLNTFEQSGFICEWEHDTVTVEIRNPSTTTILYGDSLILHADLSETLPVGWSIVWSASNGNFDYNVSDDGVMCIITPKKNGDTTFTATVYDIEGNEVCKDEQMMISKAALFDKIIALFKKIFGLTNIHLQGFKSII